MSDTLVPGLMITPTIRLSRLLGRGGMGSVWIADHLRLQTQVVVKFMAEEYLENPEVLTRFEREASLGAQAKSPHVVQVFDHGISATGLPYIAMELLEGEDLGKRLAREGTIHPLVFAPWLAQACRGLARAHSRGIIHRDIKPENIFLCDNEGEVLVKVLDFGIAKGVAAGHSFSATSTGAMLGTPYYMSPEQTMGAKDIDHRTDLWSLGVVTYFALTGRQPFDYEALGAIMSAIVSSSHPIAAPSTCNAGLSPEIDRWMARALARDRNERFSSAKELAEAFFLAAGNSAVAPGQPTVLAPLDGWDSGVLRRTAQISTVAPSSSTNPFAASGRVGGRARLLWVGTAVILVGGAIAFKLWPAATAPPPSASARIESSAAPAAAAPTTATAEATTAPPTRDDLVPAVAVPKTGDVRSDLPTAEPGTIATESRPARSLKPRSPARSGTKTKPAEARTPPPSGPATDGADSNPMKMRLE